ncbi:hypothetical protein GCM10010272_26390 [Streptomyces lateritius]|nr:hypothetical protein GCM10010272_26390 [Streptomyces lateritius]
MKGAIGRTVPLTRRAARASSARAIAFASPPTSAPRARPVRIMPRRGYPAALTQKPREWWRGRGAVLPAEAGDLRPAHGMDLTSGLPLA